VVPQVKQRPYFVAKGRQKRTTPIFIDMENKITTKASIRKSHFIASTIPFNSYPVDIVEYIVEVPSSELKRWNADTIHALEFHIFNIPNKKFYQKISFYANTLEIDAGDNENDYLVTFRFMFIGKITIKEAEVIGIEFRNIVEEDHKVGFRMKYNRMNEISDVVITLTPLQLYLTNPTNQYSIPKWLLDLISEHSLKVLPNSFFVQGLHKNLNYSFY
jgi:hypothetical protein